MRGRCSDATTSRIRLSTMQINTLDKLRTDHEHQLMEQNHAHHFWESFKYDRVLLVTPQFVSASKRSLMPDDKTHQTHDNKCSKKKGKARNITYTKCDGSLLYSSALDHTSSISTANCGKRGHADAASTHEQEAVTKGDQTSRKVP